jgi:hypothetical protein
MYGKMTTSRIGIIGRRFVSDFSLEVSMVMGYGGYKIDPTRAAARVGHQIPCYRYTFIVLVMRGARRPLQGRRTIPAASALVPTHFARLPGLFEQRQADLL